MEGLNQGTNNDKKQMYQSVFVSLLVCGSKSSAIILM